MARSQADLLALKAELTNDPEGLGLTTLPADDAANADALNLVRATLQIDREAIPMAEIAKQIDRDEWTGLSQSDRDWLTFVGAGGSINPQSGGEVREGILQIFGAGTESRTNLQSILTEDANRIDHLYKAGTLEQGGTVTASDIANARNAT